jgi:hypothetical protein
MGHLITCSNSKIVMDEIDGELTIEQVYKDIGTEGYTAGHRVNMIRIASKLGRAGWGILSTLHKLTKDLNPELAGAAEDAIKIIDPGRPNFGNFKSKPSPETSTENFGAFGTTKRKEKAQFAVQNQHGTTLWKTLEVKKVTLTELDGDIEDHARVFGTCRFCEKYTVFPKPMMAAVTTIAGPDSNGNRRLFCNFCMRNEFYKLKHNRNQLVMSFRGLIGYYYYCYYLMPKSPTLWLSDLQQVIELHIRMGVQNPLFRYDPETFCWFIDFSKVGDKRRQVPLKYVLDTTASIMAGLNMYELIKEASTASFFNKFREAINDFHHHRRRPGRRLLVPTLYGCGIPQDLSNRSIPDVWLKNFVPSYMVENKMRGRYFC